MKYPVVLSSLVAVLLTTTLLHAKGFHENELGLNQDSVFATPIPDPTIFPGKPPGGNQIEAKSYPDAPPMIPHSVTGLVPITIQSNACVGCHNNTAMIGKAKFPGMPTPMSRAHYTSYRDDKVSDNKPDGARYVCTQCHATQSNAKALVENKFKGSSSEK